MNLLRVILNVRSITAYSATVRHVYRIIVCRTQLTLIHFHCVQHTVKLHIVEKTPSCQLYVLVSKRFFPLQVTLRPKCGRMEIGKRIRRRGLLPKEITLRAPGVQILQIPDNGISSVPTENQLGLRGHFPRSSLIASTMRKLHLRVAPKRDLE